MSHLDHPPGAGLLSRRQVCRLRMASPGFDSTTFLAAYCERCDDEVLTFLDLDPEAGDRLLFRCLSCKSLVVDCFRELSHDDLENIGYSVLEARTCGNGGGCGAGGCATGSRN